jgi:hypothetical protein
MVKKLDSNGAAFLLPIVGSSNSHNIITYHHHHECKKKAIIKGCGDRKGGNVFYSGSSLRTVVVRSVAKKAPL